LMDNMKAQAVRWGAELVTEDVTFVDFSQRPFVIRSEEREVRAHTVVIATGATAKRMGLPGEAEYWNRGISACAICDGATPIFRNVSLVIIGGGDTAAEEAIFLTKYGDRVHMLIRGEKMRASKAMQDRVLNNPKITVHWQTEATEVFGENGFMTGVKVKHSQTGAVSEIAAKGLFYAIGHIPNTKLFQGQLDLDEVGYIVPKPGSVETNIAGIYAAGDVQDHEFRQAITAAGTGCMAAMLAERWLSEQSLTMEFHQSETEPPAEAKPAATVELTEFDLDATRHVGGLALRKLYHESDRLIVVKYASPTCGPCHTLKPILHKVVDEFDGRIHLIEIDVEQDPDIAEAAGVVGTPTIQFFKNKDKLAEVKGIKQKSQYRELIEHHL
jgi:thioredoxin reductase (NADPH)